MSAPIKINGAVSPIALDKPRTIPVTIPGIAEGTTCLNIAWNLVDPKANAPCLIVSGTAFKASLEATMTTGRINKVKVKPPDNTDLPKIEHMIGNPLSPYAVTKLVNELYASVFAKNYNFKTIGLRYFNIFGKRQDPNGAYAAVIPKWIASVLNNEAVYINGDGETSRDFCYVDNAVQANILAAMTENDEATDQVYNVALNDRTSLNELYRMIEDSLIKNIQGLEKKEPIYRDFRPGDVRHSQASIDKAKELLEYQPQFRIAEGLNEAIGWYINSFK